MRALADLDVLIIDCQSTGASPAFGHVLELGWGLARADRVEVDAAQAYWIELPEGHLVPRQVQKITGYEPAFRDSAIADAEAWQRLRATVGRAPAAPTAIHYARFELAFLREFAERFEPDAPFPIDAVCVHAIACRIFPELPRQSLRALAGYLGHGLDLTRRSLGHVEATAFVWRRLCVELAERQIVSWEALQAWLAERAPPRARPKKPRYPLARERYATLPDVPGVYRMLRSNGDVLYVGKAASLKKRVTSHFVGRASKLLAPEMLTQVSEIQVSASASALEAALLEHETIEALRPPYNVQLITHDPRVWYASAGFDDAQNAPDENHLLGPVPSEYSLRPLGALIALLSGAPATRSLRAHAVGVSDLWIPDEPVFAEGWAELVARHRLELSLPGQAARRDALRLAQRLLLSPELTEAVGDDVQKPEGWDAKRVARHIESAVATAYQAYRRARWLALVHDCDLVYCEPRGQGRLLRVRDGKLVEASDAQDLPVVVAPRAGFGARGRASFDRSKYDRLRVLTSELKRVCRDGGSVALRSSPRGAVSARRLAGALRVV